MQVQSEGKGIPLLRSMLSDSVKGKITEAYLFIGHALDFCENRVRLELNNDNILDHGPDNCGYEFDTIESKLFAY